jgi:hypothetical protein
VTAFSRRSVGENTWHDVFGVIAWSLQHAAAGLHPSCRHDGTPWLKSDRARLAQSGKGMLARAVVTDIRGDWAFFGEVFAFPKHNTNSGICWRCRATPSQAPMLIDVAITYVYRIALRRRAPMQEPHSHMSAALPTSLALYVGISSLARRAPM